MNDDLFGFRAGHSQFCIHNLVPNILQIPRRRRPRPPPLIFAKVSPQYTLSLLDCEAVFLAGIQTVVRLSKGASIVYSSTFNLRYFPRHVGGGVSYSALKGLPRLPLGQRSISPLHSCVTPNILQTHRQTPTHQRVRKHTHTFGNNRYS